VVIYLVDALRSDRLGVYGQKRPLSPRLDAFAAAATVYEQAWAESSWTRPAVASIFTGLEPEVHGANGRFDRLGGGMPTLAERIAGGGWQTAAVVANPNASAGFGLDRGFGEFVLMPSERRESADVHAEVVRWLDRRDPSVPFLLYVHTVDPHLPYDPPAPFRERFAAGVERRDLGSTENVGTLLARSLLDEVRWVPGLLDLYDAEVAANDHAFGELLDELSRRGLAEDTAVIFLSDHGEEFYDHGGWIHGRTLYREVLQVPLVIHLPGQREGRRESAPAAQIDLMPTILELAGLAPEPGLRGRSLLGPGEEDRALSAFLDLDGWGGWSAVQGGRHAIRHHRLGYVGPAELYELDSDPGEWRDRGGALPASAGALIEDARRELLDDAGRWEVAPAEIDDEMRRRLEALGYL
jgi:arylsulfatase A-like enzyme